MCLRYLYEIINYGYLIISAHSVYNECFVGASVLSIEAFFHY